MIKESDLDQFIRAIRKYIKNSELYRFIRINLSKPLDGSPSRNRIQYNDVLHAFYDLEVSPATFNIVAFLILAELRRKEEECAYMHVAIVPGANNDFREDHFDPGYDINNMRWRLKNVLVPCCWLLPSCRQVTVFATRQEAMAFQNAMTKHVFPKRYTVTLPIARYMDKFVVKEAFRGSEIPSLQSTPQAIAFAKDWIKSNAKGRKVVSITLRESSYEKQRNSCLGEWRKFVLALDTKAYCPVVIRDTETALTSLPVELNDLLIFREASWNIELRLAFYELSFLNLCISNGPTHLLFYDRKTAYIFFKILSPSSGYTAALFYRQIGLKPGSQPPWAAPFQRMVWKDDNADVILEEFTKMCATIEQQS